MEAASRGMKELRQELNRLEVRQIRTGLLACVPSAPELNLRLCSICLSNLRHLGRTMVLISEITPCCHDFVTLCGKPGQDRTESDGGSSRNLQKPF